MPDFQIQIRVLLAFLRFLLFQLFYSLQFFPCVSFYSETMPPNLFPLRFFFVLFSSASPSFKHAARCRSSCSLLEAVKMLTVTSMAVTNQKDGCCIQNLAAVTLVQCATLLISCKRSMDEHISLLLLHILGVQHHGYYCLIERWIRQCNQSPADPTDFYSDHTESCSNAGRHH